MRPRQFRFAYLWRSTTLRLAALVFLLQVLAAASVLVGLGAVMRQQSRAQAVDVVETLRDDLVATHVAGGQGALVEAIRLRLSNEVGRGVVVALQDSAGRLIAGNLQGVPNDARTLRAARLVEVQRRNHAAPEAAFLLAAPLRHGGTLLTGVVVESDRQFLALLERASLGVLSLSLILAAIAAWVATRQIVYRLQATVATLEGVGEGDLARRVPPDHSGDAFARLGGEVNRALARVESLNDQLKVATDALAHDLKSPLTRMTTALDRVSSRVDDADALSAVESAQAEGRRVMAIIDTALGISRAEAGIGRSSFAATDLTAMVDTLAEIYEPLAEEEGRTIIVHAVPGLTLPVHRQLMDQVLGNLIDNTMRYGAGTITVALEASESDVALSVADEGPGIPSHLHAEALRRFGRLDEARGGYGAGLGLALVAAVAHLHGGVVELGENPASTSGQPGLKVTLRLPRPAAGSV